MRKAAVLATALSVAIGLTGCDSLTEPPPGDGETVTFAPCVGSTLSPSWVAVQDGDGAWTRVNANGSGAYVFTVTSGRAGIAAYTEPVLSVVYGTTTELQDNLQSCDGFAVRTVNGTATGYASLDNMDISLGASNVLLGGSIAAPQGFSLTDVDAGARDLVGRRYRSSVGIQLFEEFPSSIFIRRNVTGTSTPAVDFNSTTEAGAPLQRTLTVANLATNEDLQLRTFLETATTEAKMSEYYCSTSSFPCATTAPFYGLPASRLVAGETQLLEMQAIKLGNTTDRRVGAIEYTDIDNKTFTFGPALGSISIVGSARPSATYTIQAAYDASFEVDFDQGDKVITLLMTKGYLGNAASVTLAVPDFSGVSGFQASWLLTPGVSMSWTFFASSADLAQLFGRAGPFLEARRSSTFTP